MRPILLLIPILAAATLLPGCASHERTRPRLATTPVTAHVVPARAVVRKQTHRLPESVLLRRQPFPQCELSRPPEGVPPDQARAAMLDYEQQCYRQRVEIEHARLNALQDAAARTRSLGSRREALLERLPPPHCEPSTPRAGLSAAEAREATLVADRECYKQLEASERQRLNALQDALRKRLKAGHIKNRAHVRRHVVQTY